jgi:hypothetical protein
MDICISIVLVFYSASISRFRRLELKELTEDLHSIPQEGRTPGNTLVDFGNNG